MTTILTQKVGSGPARTCSATCHKAAKPKCACICGGKYHGIANSKDQSPRSVEEAEAMRPKPKAALFPDEDEGPS